MNRFPPHYYEKLPLPLRCFICEQALTEIESEHYWERFPLGQHDPRCFDCASQVEIAEEEITRPKARHWISPIFVGLSLGLLVGAAIFPLEAGWAIMGAVGCANLAILARVCRK